MIVSESAGLTDAGRRRRHNEDAYVCEPPLFAIADGMGGAQAGELASRLAAAAVGRADAGALTGRERVVALVEEANRAVYERASSDESVSGMGTTMTVALLEADVVWIGHVGDSRGYRIRNGGLDQVTDDHSLVAELVRSGRLTEEEAEHHPHRSVITRALGTEPEVEIDALPVDAQAGDVFLLCSDGLTTMVDDATILTLVDGRRSELDQAAKELVAAANDAGGEDNITVVLFAIGAGDTSETTHPAEEERATEEDTLHGVAIPTAAEAPSAEERPRWPARVVATAAAIGVVALALLGVLGLSRAHFVGAEPDGHVAVYQGVPWDLPVGLRLYRKVYASPLLAAYLSEAERERLFDHDLRSRGDALSRVQAYERQVAP